MVFDRSERAILRVGAPRLYVARTGDRILIVVHQHLQVCPFRAHISHFKQDVGGQLILDIEVPLVYDRRMQTRVVAGDAASLA